jgi:hypothetical protein
MKLVMLVVGSLIVAYYKKISTALIAAQLLLMDFCKFIVLSPPWGGKKMVRI